MSESLLGQSFSITVIGMSVVFVFLLILVALMNGMSLFIQAIEKYFPQATPKAIATASNDNTLVAIAIAAAKRFQTK